MSEQLALLADDRPVSARAYIGSCAACGAPIRASSDRGACPKGCHGYSVLAPILAELNTARPCDARCMGARGPACSCSCGGRNHGRGWL